MTEPDLRDLIDRFLDGLSTADDAADLSRRLELDSAARGEYLRLAGVHAELAAGRVQPFGHSVPSGHRQSQSARRRFGLSGLAAGLVVGVLGTSLVWAYALPAKPLSDPPAMMLPLADGGFEDGPPPETDGIPFKPNTWGGDFSRVTSAEQGVSPFEGFKMLRFLRPDNASSPPGGEQRAAEVWQSIDLRPLREKLRPGPRSVEVSGHFVASADGATNTKYGLLLAAFAGDPASARDVWAVRRSVALAESSKDEAATAPPGAWQRLACQIAIPPGTDFLLVQARVTAGKAGRPEFRGSYLDGVQVRLLPPVTSGTSQP